MHWADSFAKEITETRQKDRFVVESGITPSGIVHIGNAREIMTQYFVHRALLDLGRKSTFQYVWDDFDRFRKVPSGVPESFGAHLGLPVSRVPDPFGCHKTYADHYKEGLVKELKLIGVETEFISAAELYGKCKFAENIKTALEKTEEIKKVLNAARAEVLTPEWLPVTVYCEKCGKDNTKVKYPGGYEIEYSCECGFSNKIDFRKVGIVKLKWRVDWPSRWAYFGVDFESAGKDHMASGGSWDTGTLISKEVFGYEPPVGTMYEFIYLKGQEEKMSKSKGNVATLTTLLEIYEPEVVRFMYTQRLKKAVFVPFDTDIYSIYDSFDCAEKGHYGLAESEDETKRRYELSRLENYERCPVRISFSELVNLLQTVSPDKLQDQAEALLKQKDSQADFSDLGRALSRMDKARFWLENYAPKDMQLSLIEEPVSLDEPQKLLLKQIAENIIGLDGEEEILNVTYETIKSAGLKPKEMFTFLYRTLIGKDRGPRFGVLVLILGREKVVERLRELSECQ
ncbi:MAG: lysine--tRNA ligase [Candidatus Aenigmarchaeota archaeon]|nr:lysine--tRNA ligase [Candidatus Aenigmarchaeota archaeon]